MTPPLCVVHTPIGCWPTASPLTDTSYLILHQTNQGARQIDPTRREAALRLRRKLVIVSIIYPDMIHHERRAMAAAAAATAGEATPDLDGLEISHAVGDSSPLALMVMFALALLLAASVLAQNHWRRATGVGGEIEALSMYIMCVRRRRRTGRSVGRSIDQSDGSMTHHASTLIRHRRGQPPPLHAPPHLAAHRPCDGLVGGGAGAQRRHLAARCA